MLPPFAGMVYSPEYAEVQLRKRVLDTAVADLRDGEPAEERKRKLGWIECHAAAHAEATRHWEDSERIKKEAATKYAAQGADLAAQVFWHLERIEWTGSGETITTYYQFQSAPEVIAAFVRMFHPWNAFRLTVKLNAGSLGVQHRWMPPLGSDYVKMCDKWGSPEGEAFPYRKDVIDAALAQLLAVSR